MRPRLLKLLKQGLLLCVLSLIWDWRACAEDWPEVRDFELSVGLRMNGPRLDLDIPFYDIYGKIVYRLICRGGDDARHEEFGDLAGGYLWPMTCILNLGNRETGFSLLSEDESAAYFSRGAVYDFDLMTCGNYPEYGRVRHFRLRGFELTFEFTDLVVNPSISGEDEDFHSPLEYAILKVSVRHDKSIASAKVEQTGYIYPAQVGGICGPVTLGNKPRMCRNTETFSWEECPEGFENQRFKFEDRLQQEERMKADLPSEAQ